MDCRSPKNQSPERGRCAIPPEPCCTPVIFEMRFGGGCRVRWLGGQDTDSLTSIKITVPNRTEWHTTDSAGNLANSGTPYAKPDVGAVMKLHPAADWPSGQKHVVVVGSFNDGASQVIPDTMV